MMKKHSLTKNKTMSGLLNQQPERNPADWMQASINALRYELDSSIVDDVQEKWAAAKEYLQANDAKENCHQCGGKKVLIRGKYPNWDKRAVCPTCTYERLEQIHEMSSANYNQALKTEL